MIENYQRYTTSALRLAATFVGNDIGKHVLDLETGHVYLVMGEGSGAATMRRVATNRTTAATIPLALGDFLEVTSGGDPGNVAAIGGGLASDTTPILRGDAAESLEIVWASSNSDIISTSISLPADFDGTRDVTIELTGFSGTTNAFTFTVETGWDGGALVSDTATGTASATSQNISATVAAADIPDAPRRLTLMLTPAAHTTDAFDLTAVRVRYFPS